MPLKTGFVAQGHIFYMEAQLLSILSNVYWTSNHHIKMISEGSCDTKDWSNDAENSALQSGINYTNIFK